MRKDKELAIKLRLQGKSYSQIRDVLGISKGTLSSWLSSLQLSPVVANKIQKRGKKIAIKTLIERNKSQTTEAVKRRNKIKNNAKKFVKNISQNDLFFLGVALYWAEGYKRVKKVRGREVTSHPVSLTNSDPNLIKIFLRFLREICLVQEGAIKADIRIFEHQNENTLLNFWSDITDIPTYRFGKTYYGVSKSSLGKRPFNILPFGTIQIRVNNTNLFHMIMGWIEGVATSRGSSVVEHSPENFGPIK